MPRHMILNCPKRIWACCILLELEKSTSASKDEGSERAPWVCIAGKSTLLDILAGCRGPGSVRGVLRMNGKRLGNRFKRVSAYVEQEDAFVPTMTCWETLVFHARLRTGAPLLLGAPLLAW
jgi:hypothetical protein